MLYQNREVRQQYGIKAEKVPEYLNRKSVLIQLVPVSEDDKSLLFRDGSEGDKLVTERIARDLQKELEKLVRRDSERFHKRIRSLPQYPQEDYIVVVTPINGYSNYSA